MALLPPLTAFPRFFLQMLQWSSRVMPLLALACLPELALRGDETPQLVRDLNMYGTYPANLTVVGDRIFFASRDLEHGDELWCYDGTQSRLVADLEPGAGDATPSELTAVGGKVCFVARGKEVWVSDGTAAGTVQLGGLPGNIAQATDLRGDGQRIYMRISIIDPISARNELWVTDGTTAGTLKLPVEGTASFQNFPPVTSAGKFFFPNGYFGNELWVTDGTPAGTQKLAVNTAAMHGALTVAANGLVYIGWDEPWVTDGTIAGTQLVADIRPGTAASYPINRIALGNRVVFFADDGTHGREPWISDGTSAGTHMIKDIAPGSADGIAATGTYYTESGPVPSPADDATVVGAAGGRVVFLNKSDAAGWELWATDGTEANTGLLADLYPGPIGSLPRKFTPLGNQIVFTAYGSADTGEELWITDGTTGGTRLLADLYPGPMDSRADGFTPYRNGLVFRACDGEGTKLCFTDGTPTGTVMLDPRFSVSHDGGFRYLVASGNRLFFNFSDDDDASCYLATSDGTAAGTKRIYGPIAEPWDPSIASITAYSLYALGDGKVLWTPWVDGLGTELWYSDGATEGTGLLMDFSTDTDVDASSPTGFARLGHKVYFVATPYLRQRKYYQLDDRDLSVNLVPLVAGDSAVATDYAYAAPQVAGGLIFANQRRSSTELHLYANRPDGGYTDLNVGTKLSYAAGGADKFMAYRGQVYFTMNKFPSYELWRTNAGATAAERFPVGTNDRPIAVVNDRLLIRTGDELSVSAIYGSDGTAGGTVKLIDGESLLLLGTNDRRAFVIDRHYTGTSPLWVTDGTVAGTRRVHDFENWALNTTTVSAVSNGVIFFQAGSAAAGHELWRSDGTATGTRMVADLWPGPGDGASNLIAGTDDGRVYFIGRSPYYGYELFSLTPDAAPPEPPADPGRLVNLSSRVQADTGNNVAIGGFVIAGSTPKRLLLRAVGPSLTTQGLAQAEVMTNPAIEVYDARHGNAVIATNDNWGEAANPGEITALAAQFGATGLAGTDTKSSALVATLSPGVYSFIAHNQDKASGIVLVEAYDTDPAAATPLVNLSTRAYCGSGNNVTIGGFVVAGGARKRLLLRAVGPTLATQGLGAAEVLADPIIEVHDASHGNVVIATNDNWGDNDNQTELLATASRVGATPLAGSDTQSSAMLITLDPGVYSFVARGKNGATGIVLVEAYDTN